MKIIDMSYYNVYYYCNILDNLLHLFTTSIDWVATSAQFKESFYEGDINNFPKYSALHSFCDYAIRQLIYEEDAKELEIIESRYNEDYAKMLNNDERLLYAFRSEYENKHRLWADRLLHNYGNKNESFYEYMKNKEFQYLEDEYNDFLFMNGEYGDAVYKLTREVFHVLFKNRDFLFRFNYYMAKQEGEFSRCTIPSWVKRAVKYRDGGKCVCCGKDLSGILDREEDNSIHFDHMISLKSGGLNDVTNIQLMCRECNLKKSSDSKTSNFYKDWYDMDD